jgi:ubiquitin-protein ligase
VRRPQVGPPNPQPCPTLTPGAHPLRTPCPPRSGISFSPEDEDSLCAFHANVQLLDGPHTGAVLHLLLIPPADYPNSAPKAFFRTPISGVFTGGATSDTSEGTSICLDLLSNFKEYHSDWGTSASGWSPSMKLETLLCV